MNRYSENPNYDKYPVVAVPDAEDACVTGWREVGRAIARAIASRPGGTVRRGPTDDATPERAGPAATEDAATATIVAVECYQGAFEDEIGAELSAAIPGSRIIRSSAGFKDPELIDEMVEPYVTDDPIFGFMSRLTLRDFFDDRRLASSAAELRETRRGGEGVVLVVGPGASLLCEAAEAPEAPNAPAGRARVRGADVLVYADMARWEIQARSRAGEMSNLGVSNPEAGAKYQYKRGYFVDWRVLDRHKRAVFRDVDFFLDTNDRETPKLAPGDAVRRGLAVASQRPFRVVPFFDPGVWGGQWMREVCDLPDGPPNYAWCFDCVPEENSLVLGFDETRFELPAIDLVFEHPRELLGDPVYGRFGPEFPIRFDFLDTMEGQNLSFQVHPLTEFIHREFDIPYTQDESYYLLDAEPGAVVYLGLREGVDPAAMREALETAQAGGPPFPDEKFVQTWPVKQHDHVPIPAGTCHCSGKGCMVLEISATPYIFTMKLWDWGRVDLDGKPRPINIDRGMANIQWYRTTDWTRRNLIGRVEPRGTGDGWRSEWTGLHEFEFIETHRHWFTKTVEHDTGGRAAGSVNVLNLVQGREAVVESPDGAFEPFVVHYAETFIVPAAVGRYTIRPVGEAEGSECATIKASVRH